VDIVYFETPKEELNGAEMIFGLPMALMPKDRVKKIYQGKYKLYHGTEFEDYETLMSYQFPEDRIPIPRLKQIPKYYLDWLAEKNKTE
jgi:hypothetical protein